MVNVSIDFLNGLTPLKPEPYPYNQLQIDWLAALRSGKYKQSGGWLKSPDGYCCLGVLCEIAGYKSSQIGGTCLFHDKPQEPAMYGVYLPQSAVKLARFYGSLGKFHKQVKFPKLVYGENAGHTSLASMNDARMIGTNLRPFTFKEIADYIEFDPWNVFTNPEETIE